MSLGRRRGILRERTDHSYFAREVLLPARQFIRTAGAGAGVLFAATAIALLWAN